MLGREEFLSSPLIQDGTLRNLQVMAELTQRLSDRVKALRPDVDWRAIAGFRNVLAHNYLGFDLDYVYRAIENDVPRLREACQFLLQQLGSTK